MNEEQSYSQKSMKELRIGSFVLIDDTACKVVEVEGSHPGKHGSSKVRITAVGIFDGTKRTLLKPSDADVEVPEIKKRRAQVVSVTATSVQLMDLESYEIYDVGIPVDVKELKPGNEVEVLESTGKKIITRIVGNI